MQEFMGILAKTYLNIYPTIMGIWIFSCVIGMAIIMFATKDIRESFLLFDKEKAGQVISTLATMLLIGLILGIFWLISDAIITGKLGDLAVFIKNARNVFYIVFILLMTIWMVLIITLAITPVLPTSFVFVVLPITLFILLVVGVAAQYF